MTHSRWTAVLIAKEPIPGKVKTRCSPPLTVEEAALMAEAALLDSIDALAGSSAERKVLLFDGVPPATIPGEFDVVAQTNGGLDRRLEEGLLAIGGPAVLIGMDTPQVSAQDIDDAARRLLAPGVDAVIGHATDGGFWLVGLREPGAGMFVGVPMSVSITGSEQERRLRDLGLVVRDVPKLADVDSFEQAIAVAKDCATGSRFVRVVESLQARVSGS